MALSVFRQDPGLGDRLSSETLFNATGLSAAVALGFFEVVSGSASATLGAMVVVAAGTTVAPATGALSVTLSATTAVSAGTVAVQGAATPTLSATTAVSAGTVAVQGAATPTLSATTAVSAGTVAVQGAATPTLSEVAASSTGAVAIRADASPTLDAFTVASVATAPHPTVASLVATLGEVSAYAHAVKRTWPRIDAALRIRSYANAKIGRRYSSASSSLDYANALTGAIVYRGEETVRL